MNKKMDKKSLLILLVAFIPVMIYATAFSYGGAVDKQGSFHSHYYDSDKYIYQTNAGMLTKSEYDLTKPINSNYGFSYIFDGQPFWINEGYVDGRGDANTESGATGTSDKGFKATLYVDSTTNSAGTGTYSNPWIFLQKYNVSLIVDSRHGGICKQGAEPRCSVLEENATKIVLDKQSVEFDIAAEAGFSYLSNTCNGVYISGGGNGTGTIRIDNDDRNIVNCQITFGTGLYSLEIHNKNPDTGEVYNKVLVTIYEEYSKGWFTTNDKERDLSRMTSMIDFYNENDQWLLNVKEKNKPNYLAPESGGYHFGGISIPVSKLDGSGVDRELCDAQGKIKDSTQIKSDMIGEIKWDPNEYNIVIKDCHSGTCTDSGSQPVLFNEKPELGSKIKNYSGQQLLGYYSSPDTNSTLVFDENGTYQIETGEFGLRYRTVGNTTVYAMYKTCERGSYSNGGEDSNYKCTPCPANTYSANAGASVCQGCPWGSVSAAGSYQCSWCEAGYAPSGWHCKKCSAGKYSENGKECKNCPDGRYSGEAAAECEVCPEGHQSNTDHTGCTKCENHYYRNQNVNKCIKCAEGNITTANHDQCSPCPAGKTADGDQINCQNCPGGYYSDPAKGQYTCSICPAGTYGPEENGTGPVACYSCNNQDDPSDWHVSTMDPKAYTSKPGQTACSVCNEYQEVKVDAQGRHIGCTNNKYDITLHNELDLPDGYTQLAYIENPNGNSAYINLGVRYTNGMGLYLNYHPYDPVADFVVPNNDDDEEENDDELADPKPVVVVLGAENTGDNRSWFMVSNTQETHYASNIGGIHLWTVSNDKKIWNISYTPGSNNTLTFVNNRINGGSRKNYSFRNVDYDIYLFANNQDGTATQNSHGKIYRLKFFNGSSTSYDFIPCKNSSGIVGLCNLLARGRDNFFLAPQNGSLTGGNEITVDPLVFGENTYDEPYKKITDSNYFPTSYANTYKLTFDGWFTASGDKIYTNNGDPAVNKKFLPEYDGHFIEDLYAHWRTNDNY